MRKPGPFDPAATAPAGTASARREFLKAGAAAAGATLLSSCVGGGGGDAPLPLLGAPQIDPLSRFDHLVVLMFENRSFDNLLGYLYPPGSVTYPAGSAFNGLAGGTYANPVPPYILDGHTSVAARQSPGAEIDMTHPDPDPGEPFPHVNTQLYGLVDPASNEFESTEKMRAPYNAPTQGQPLTMQGFVHDYCNNFMRTQKRLPTYDEYRVIMDSFGPDALPVLSTLARSFAVYDAWFCAVPSQTYCNRSFFHASTSSGHVVNEPVLKWTKNDAPTIFNRLQDAGRTWRVYCDGPHSLTSLIHWPVLSQFCASNFRTMQDFYNDAQNGTLPDYAFVEPKFGAQGNDFHPPNNVLLGEQFLHDVYTAVRTSASPTGSNALNTLLLVTFDEHGGCYDHVAPPPATSPERFPVTGDMGFRFDRLGVRVPSIAVSAYTHQNTVVNRPVHHAAVISTLCHKFGLANLTERDLDAPDLRDAINLDAPRAPSSWPQTVPRPPLPAAYNAAMPVNDLERDMAALALAVARGSEPTAESLPKTVGEADAMLKALATECRVAT
jgi:phospholipase C